MIPTVLFTNVLADTYETLDNTYWQQSDCTEFLTLVESGSAKDLLGWLVGIRTQDVDTYVQEAGVDVRSDEGLPFWMRRFRPNYKHYQATVEGIEDTAPVRALLVEIEDLEIIEEPPLEIPHEDV